MKEQMTAGQNSPDDYEYGERAAIREFDGGFEKFEANQFALIDIRERELSPDVNSQKAVEEQREENPEPVTDDQQSSPKKRKIEQLRQKAEQTRKLMLAESDPQREKKLFTEWMDIYSELIELKKGV